MPLGEGGVDAEEAAPDSVADGAADLLGPAQVETPDAAVEGRGEGAKSTVEGPSGVGPLEGRGAGGVEEDGEVEEPGDGELGGCGGGWMWKVFLVSVRYSTNQQIQAHT